MTEVLCSLPDATSHQTGGSSEVLVVASGVTFGDKLEVTPAQAFPEPSSLAVMDAQLISATRSSDLQPVDETFVKDGQLVQNADLGSPSSLEESLGNGVMAREASPL